MSLRDLSVASYNMHKGVGTDGRRDLGRISAVIAEIGADILALQEADKRFGDKAGLLDLEHLRRDLGLVPVPMESLKRAHGWHGNLLLVRNALVEQVHQLVLPGFEPRGAVVSDLVVGGKPLRVVAAHFGLLPASRAAQSRALLEKLDGLDDRPTLLMGDLNEWRVGGSVAMTHLQRFFVVPDSATQPRSFPARYPLFPLDRMMTCTKAELRDLQTHDTPLAKRASDHLPIKATWRIAAE